MPAGPSPVNTPATGMEAGARSGGGGGAHLLPRRSCLASSCSRASSAASCQSTCRSARLPMGCKRAGRCESTQEVLGSETASQRLCNLITGLQAATRVLKGGSLEAARVLQSRRV